jgi:hypothetical protein
VTDQQLWGTLHSDTSFDLKRTNTVDLPNLKLLQTGFPFAAPQDLSTTAIVVPKSPSVSELRALLEFGERLGRLTKAQSVQFGVYTADALPVKLKETQHLVGIGTQKKFPFPEVFTSGGLT